MKTTSLAVLLTLLTAGRPALAQGPAGAGAADAEAARSAAEARAVVATLFSNAQGARDAYNFARGRRRPDEVRCTSEALSQANVTLRSGRDDALLVAASFSSGEVQSARSALARLRQRSAVSREAAIAANQCFRATAARALETTSVTVTIDPQVARLDPGFP